MKCLKYEAVQVNENRNKTKFNNQIMWEYHK